MSLLSHIRERVVAETPSIESMVRSQVSEKVAAMCFQSIQELRTFAETELSDNIKLQYVQKGGANGVFTCLCGSFGIKYRRAKNGDYTIKPSDGLTLFHMTSCMAKQRDASTEELVVSDVFKSIFESREPSRASEVSLSLTLTC